MKIRVILIPAICAVVFFCFFSGIYRHDVKEEMYIKLAAEKQFDCVGKVLIDKTELIGSCVLIGEKHVLSAAHVFTGDESLDLNNLFFDFMGEKIKAKKLIIHPEYNEWQGSGICDLAIIELEEAVKDIIPAKINIEFDELHSDVVGVGYGVSGPANRPDKVGMFNKKIAGENIVDTISGATHHGHRTLLGFDFDHKSRDDCNKMGSAVPKPLEYIASGGDSGGGLFREKNNEWELIGIFMGEGTDLFQLLKTGYYGQTMGSTRVSVFAGWINEHTKQ